jgi:hypothetical protein
MPGGRAVADAIVVAGYVSATGAESAAIPSMRFWLGGGLILAAFGDVRPHAGGHVIVLDVAELGPPPPWPRQCKALIAGGGRRCRLPTRPGSAFCQI